VTAHNSGRLGSQALSARVVLTAIAEHGCQWADHFHEHSELDVTTALRREVRAGHIADGGEALSERGLAALNRLNLDTPVSRRHLHGRRKSHERLTERSENGCDAGKTPWAAPIDNRPVEARQTESSTRNRSEDWSLYSPPEQLR
jgi:hypothetical protein